MLNHERIREVAVPSNRQMADAEHYGAAVTFLLLYPEPIPEDEIMKSLHAVVNAGIDSAIGHRGLSAWHAAMRTAALLWVLEDTDFDHMKEVWLKQNNYGLDYFKAVAAKYRLLLPPG